MHEGRSAKIAGFVEWCGSHITGDEKGQAQIFLDRLFQPFGQKRSLDVGGSPEMRIKLSSEDGRGTRFADYVWKPVVLVEMKKRRVDLSKHFQKAFEYWTRLVPNRPRYVVLCNFDRFDVYDFGLRAVYRSLELPGSHPLKDAHAALDAAVLDAHGFSPTANLLKQLLDLNHVVAAKERAGEPVTAPAVPPSFGDPSSLITNDCIRPVRTPEE